MKAKTTTGYRSGFCGTGQCSRCPRAQGKCRCSCHDEADRLARLQEVEIARNDDGTVDLVETLLNVGDIYSQERLDVAETG